MREQQLADLRQQESKVSVEVVRSSRNYLGFHQSRIEFGALLGLEGLEMNME